MEVKMIPIDKIRPAPFQPRELFDKEKIANAGMPGNVRTPRALAVGVCQCNAADIISGRIEVILLE